MEAQPGASDAGSGMIREARWAVAACLVAACAPADPALRAEANWEACEASQYPLQQIEACSAVIDDASADPSRRAAALINRGAQRSNLGQHARAVADFGRALRLSPNNPHVYVERGLVHQSRGAYEAALRAFDAALAIDPTMELASQRRQAAIADMQRASQQEMAEISQALMRDPRNAELLNARCWLRAIHDDDLSFALADCNAALEVDPHFAAAFDSRGLVQLKRGAPELALADYDAALKIEPNRGHFRYGRGLARLRLGLRAEGEADLAAAELAEPGVAVLYRSYGVAP